MNNLNTYPVFSNKCAEFSQTAIAIDPSLNNLEHSTVGQYVQKYNHITQKIVETTDEMDIFNRYVKESLRIGGDLHLVDLDDYFEKAKQLVNGKLADLFRLQSAMNCNVHFTFSDAEKSYFEYHIKESIDF